MLLGNGAEHKTSCNELVYSSAESQGNLQGSHSAKRSTDLKIWN